MVTGDEEVQWAYLLGPMFQIENTKGVPATGGWLEVYIHGTRNKYYCAKDFDGTLHPFKIPLDGLGANIVLASPAHAYDVYAYNKYGSLIMSRYNIVPATGDGSIVKDVVAITSNDGTVDVSTSDQTNWDLSIKDTTDQVAQNTSDISDIKDDIDDINTALDGKKNVQTAKTFTGAATKTVKKITQNANGEMNVEFEDIDLPAEVPNVEITSEDNSIQISESIDVQTNTKTFDLSVNVDDALEYGQFRATDVNTQAQLVKVKGNINLNNYAISLKKGNSYHFTIRGSYVATDTANTNTTITYIEPSTFNGIQINVDNTITDPQFFEISYDVYNFSQNMSYNVAFAAMTGGKVSELWVEVHNLNGVSVNGGGGGAEYTATAPININNDNISLNIDNNGALGVLNSNLKVNVDPSSGIDIANNKLVVKVGNGLTVDPVSGLIIIDSEVGDVVETVEKLKKDLDTQITTNFDMPNISQVFDFADSTNWITANGACMLYQAFTIPINHDIRTISEDSSMPTLFGIYAQQSFGHKIMLALYEYQYAGTGEEAGSSTYVGDTGPVTVLQGVNEYPLKNRNPSITELRSDRVYYASLYLPSDAFANGLYLAGCPGYGNQSIPAVPRLSCATENITWQNVELDMDDPTTTLNHYQVIQIPGQDPYYQYYIGPWVGGYNERWSSPRFYMQIRNGEYNEPIIPTEPFIDLGNDKLPRGGISAANLPDFNSSTANSGFRDVTPLINVTITSYEWIDNMENVGGWEAANCVFNSDYSTNMSGVSNTVTNLGEVFRNESYTAYAHRITFTTPITLTANVTYRFLCSSWSSSSNWIWSWADPTDVFDAGNNGWYIDWNSNVLRYANQAGQYLKLYDNNNNHWVI